LTAPGPTPADGRRADLDQVIAELPLKERQQLAGLLERLALQQVAYAAGTEMIWGVASCRAPGGSGVIALTDDRVIVCLLNAPQQPWLASVPLGDVELDYAESSPGCEATLTYGSVELDLSVGRDTAYAVAFLGMTWDRISSAGADPDSVDAAASAVPEPAADPGAGSAPVAGSSAGSAAGLAEGFAAHPARARDVAALIGMLAVIEGELVAGEMSPHLAQRLGQRLARHDLLQPDADAAGLRQALAALNERLRHVLGGSP
jgi:hypothetical protein